MALSDGTTNVTSSATIAGGVGKILGDAIIAFNKVNVISPLVTTRIGVTNAKTVEFTDYTIASHLDVTEATESTDTTAQAIATTARTATLSEHVMQVNISDLAEQSYGAGGSLGANAGAIIGNAISARLDDDLANLFAAGSLSNDACGAGTALAISHIFDCLRVLNASQAPAPYNLVLGVKQTYGAKGLRALIVDDAVTGSNSKPFSTFGGAVQGQELANNGFVTRFAGFDVYTSPQVTEISGDDEEGCAFSKGAFGFATGAEGIMSIETQRDASKRLTEYIGTGVWGETLIKDDFAVSLTSDVS